VAPLRKALLISSPDEARPRSLMRRYMSRYTHVPALSEKLTITIKQSCTTVADE
jgi:hypothetical protein